MVEQEDAENFNELDREIELEARRKIDPVLVCPQCNSVNITYYMGLKTGVQYQCKECGYIGAFIIEKDREQIY